MKKPNAGVNVVGRSLLSLNEKRFIHPLVVLIQVETKKQNRINTSSSTCFTMASTESTPLLGEEAETWFRAMVTAVDVAYNWKWILAVGIVNVAAGILCFVSPIVASHVAEAILAWTLTLVGALNLSGLCFAEKTVRGYYGFMGLLQLAVGITMIKNPFKTLFVLTLMIGVLVLLDGLFAIMCCLSNRDLKGWGFGLASGVASTCLGVLVLTGLPESSLYTIGILLGVNFLTIGNFRIHVALAGREIMA